jgi:hypothetical protein
MNAIPAESSSSWITEGVDTQKFFSNFYSRAIALDDSSYPHIAYGGDHLYYVYQNGSGWSYETIDFSSNVIMIPIKVTSSMLQTLPVPGLLRQWMVLMLREMISEMWANIPL